MRKILLSVAAMALMAFQSVAQTATHELKFDENGKFKIVQFTDLTSAGRISGRTSHSSV